MDAVLDYKFPLSAALDLLPSLPPSLLFFSLLAHHTPE